MGVFTFYVFNRKGTCLFYREWKRPNNPLADNPKEDQRLVFGLIFSLQKLCLQLSPKAKTSSNIEGLHSYRTSRYSL